MASHVRFFSSSVAQTESIKLSWPILAEVSGQVFRQARLLQPR